MNLADISVFISCAMSLAAFDIRKPIENGRVIEPVFGALSGTVRCVGCPTTISGLAHYYHLLVIPYLSGVISNPEQPKLRP